MPYRTWMIFEETTGGIIVRAMPAYQAARSVPYADNYFWTYAIEIENRSEDTVQLRARRWRITDANGLVREVAGPGVVGDTPILKPGDTYRYTSGCPLETPSGLMVGTYEMIDVKSGARFEIAIPAFALDGPRAARMN